MRLVILAALIGIAGLFTIAGEAQTEPESTPVFETCGRGDADAPVWNEPCEELEAER